MRSRTVSVVPGEGRTHRVHDRLFTRLRIRVAAHGMDAFAVRKLQNISGMPSFFVDYDGTQIFCGCVQDAGKSLQSSKNSRAWISSRLETH